MNNDKIKPIPLTFKNNAEEIELYKWIKEKSKIVGQANFIKDVLYKKMKEDKAAR